MCGGDDTLKDYHEMASQSGENNAHLRNDITTHDAAKDVYQNSSDLVISSDNAERLFHLQILLSVIRERI